MHLTVAWLLCCWYQSCHDPVAVDSTIPFLCRRCEYLEAYAETHPKIAALPLITCALCPREGGIFKRTDKGAWVHVFCALLTPGVVFGDPDHLEDVSLKHVDRRVRAGSQTDISSKGCECACWACIACLSLLRWWCTCTRGCGCGSAYVRACVYPTHMGRPAVSKTALLLV